MDKFYLGVYKKLIRNNEMIRKWLFIMSFFLLIICNSGYCAPERMGNEESSGASLVETESIGIAAPVNFQKITQWVKALGLITIAMVVAIYFLRKKIGIKAGMTGRKQYIHVVNSVSLGPKKAIHLVKIPGKILLIGVTNERIQSLSEITEKDIVDSIVTESKGGEFMSIFKRAYSGI
ncbi:MAG: hypothetical protein EX330_12575 [Candidatus Brocadia sp. BROELEC01]|jgi:flagellar biosynthetic protein FliO|nr:MAG: flagellar biosynthetic protein FliO [Candidatus Brocadia sp.]RZV56719.1 MAG: hypothetical protein EX330_12575 [Candidatus Brocadia sp. BROELEC01]